MKKGQTHTEETKNKLRIANIGKKLSSDVKTKIHNSLKGRSTTKMTDDIKRKISNALTGRKLSEETKEKLRNVKQSNETIEKRVAKLKGQKRTLELKERLSKLATGRKHSPETIIKLKELHKNISSETRLKMRLSRIKYLKNVINNGGQIHPNYNINACKIIDEYGKNNGYNFQHAENGGEYYIKELGYWVDGYDSKNNIVLEIDEKTHFDVNGNLHEKDIIRQNEIQNFLKCNFIRLKYEENLNKNRYII